MAYLGNRPAEAYSAFQKQDFSTSATTSYTLDHPVANGNEIALFINFVRQEPTAAYTASGTTLTLTSATASTDDMYCVYLGKAVQTVNPPSGSVGASQLASDAVTAAKLNDDIISGQTALASEPADTDEFLVSDAGTLKRVDYSYLKSANTPAFKVTLSSNQTLADDTLTRIAWDTEEYDTDSAFASNIFTVPSGEGGKYVFEYHVFGDDIDDADTWSSYLELDGVQIPGSIAEKRGVSSTNNCLMNNTVTTTCSAGQTVEVVSKHQGTSGSQEIRSNNSFFSGYKLIGI